MGKKKSSKRTTYTPFEEDIKVHHNKRHEEKLSKSSNNDKDATSVQIEVRDEYKKKSFERNEEKLCKNNKDVCDDKIENRDEYKKKRSKRIEEKQYKNSNNNKDMTKDKIENRDEYKKKSSERNEEKLYKNNKDVCDDKIENRDEYKKKSSESKNEENPFKNSNNDMNNVKIKDMDEYKKKSSKRTKNALIEDETKSYHHFKRNEVETTNYGNGNEDLKNNQIEDKSECKESLNEGVKTENIIETNRIKYKAENHHKTKRDLRSKDFVDKKSQNEQNEIDMDNSTYKSNEKSYNSSKKSTNKEEHKSNTRIKNKNKKNNKFDQQSEDSLDDNIKKKLNNTNNNETLFTNKFLEEIDEDLFSLPKEVPLAHCVAEDLRMGAGIAVDFKRIYGSVGKLLDQNLKIGDVGIVNRHDQYVFYLITKKYSNGKPNMMTMEMALKSLLNKMKKLNLNKLGIPKIGCGLDALDWSDVKLLIMDIFKNSGIQIFVCIPSKIIERKAPQSLKVYITPNNLWEMQDKTDIIILINLEEIRINKFSDNVIDNVNTRYPFKENLLKDIKNYKYNPGDITHYSVNNEDIFCGFIKQNDYSSLEEAFKNILNFSSKKRYMYMAIQSGSIGSGDKFKYIAQMVLILRSISSFSELWLCGDSTQTTCKPYDLYCRSIRDSINYSSKYNSPNQINYQNSESSLTPNKNYIKKTNMSFCYKDSYNKNACNNGK